MTQSDLSHPFANFLYSFGAARKLLERAQERGSFIEGIVLYVSMIGWRLALKCQAQWKRLRAASCSAVVRTVSSLRAPSAVRSSSALRPIRVIFLPSISK